jgi:dCMP deaminase
MRRSNVVLVSYVPVPHAGYLKFFRAYPKSILYILGEKFIRQFPSLTRHLPGARPREVREMIESLRIFPDVRILNPPNLKEVQKLSTIVMPDEDVSHAMAEKYFSGVLVTFDGRWRLRWDWGATQQKRRPENERVISTDELDRELMRNAFKLANKSPDLWRQIGALLVKDGKVILSAFNRHVPSEQSVYCYGDPRSNFEPGQCIDASSALHAEAGIIAEAANRGISTKGCDLYVTTFPCPPCAYLCAQSGIGRLFYVDGYALVSGAEDLQAKGVEIIRVEM